ncbi:MAG: putative selenium-dependent hydroxylase accessory protein YqeC [Lentisphaeria bacterium]|nr:putative selenium-dependent hydroxylase accessory protein YqeC [Candidatus Neomarinimicrobiota bacterium]MCF7841481.1 putative selenium-dependent hydroxylase accessory protein YqeC [Lentisphaeria bacterium]
MRFTQMIFGESEILPGNRIAIMGGGGKTSLLHRLGEEFSQLFPRVVMTALTRSAVHPEHPILFADDVPGLDLTPLFQPQKPLCIMGGRERNKLTGISVDQLERIYPQVDVTLFESDGARNLPLKAHLPHDPVVPPFTTLVVILVGADVVNTTLADCWVHRPDIFREKWQITPNMPLSVEFIARVVSTPAGYLEKVPADISRIYFVNKGDAHRENARKLAAAIHAQTPAPVFWGSIQRKFWECVS